MIRTVSQVLFQALHRQLLVVADKEIGNEVDLPNPPGSLSLRIRDCTVNPGEYDKGEPALAVAGGN
jgi:hypothetical protein